MNRPTRYAVLLSLLLACSCNALGQDVTLKAFGNYELEKKEKSTAYLLSIIPGGGLFHAGKIAPGILFLLSEVAAVSWLVSYTETGVNAVVVPLLICVSLKIGEFVVTSNAIDQYNEGVRKRLGLAASFSQRGMTATITFSF
jgi:hypothetical protein